jgi:hypothetical protein
MMVVMHLTQAIFPLTVAVAAAVLAQKERTV